MSAIISAAQTAEEIQEISLSKLLAALVSSSYLELQNLAQKCVWNAEIFFLFSHDLLISLRLMDGKERRIFLLQYLNRTRLRFIKLLVASKWAQKASDSVTKASVKMEQIKWLWFNFDYWKTMSQFLKKQNQAFPDVANELYFKADYLRRNTRFEENWFGWKKCLQKDHFIRAPIYDVPSAVEVLSTGSYSRLPLIMAVSYKNVYKNKRIRLNGFEVDF